jgi:hypothetical protein
MPGYVRVTGVPEHLAVDLEVGAKLTIFPPQSRLAQRPVFGFKVCLPKLPWLYNMGVTVKDCEALPRRHCLSSVAAVAAISVAALNSCRAPFLSGGSMPWFFLLSSV